MLRISQSIFIMEGLSAWECTVTETNRLRKSGSLEQSQGLSRVIEIVRMDHHHLGFKAIWASYIHSLQISAFDGVEGSFHDIKKINRVGQLDGKQISARLLDFLA